MPRSPLVRASRAGVRRDPLARWRPRRTAVWSGSGRCALNKLALLWIWAVASVQSLPLHRRGARGTVEGGPVTLCWFCCVSSRLLCPLSSGGQGVEKPLPGDLPWWMARRGGGFGGRCLNKLVRCLLLFSLYQVVLSLSAGRGGEGEVMYCAASSAVQDWRREILDSASPSAVPQRRRCYAAAILGQRAGPAVLGSCGCSSFFLLWRIFFSFDAAPNAHASPSGLVPGGDQWSGRVWRLVVVGKLGLDRVSAVLVRVLCVIPKDLVSIPCFLWVLYVFVCPMPT